MKQNTLRIREDFHALIQTCRNAASRAPLERMSENAASQPQPPENVPTATHSAPGMQPEPDGSAGKGQKGKRRPNAMVKTARVVHAMTALAEGSAANKREAAEMMGLSPTALTPANLAETLSSHHASSLLSIDPLDITAAHEGVRVSLRDVLSKGMESAIETLASLRPLVGKMDKAQREAFRQARDWLALCRENGLWKTPVGVPQLPGLPIAAPEPADEDTPGSAAWYLRNMNRHREPAGATECGGIAPAIPAST